MAAAPNAIGERWHVKCTPLRLAMTAPAAFNQPPHPSAQILDSAAALARAEVKLLWSHARRLGGRVAVALGLTWLAMTLTQLSLLLLALSPLIAASYGAVHLAASLAPALLLSALAWGLSIKRWLALNEGTSGQHNLANPSALELPVSEPERR
jgi:hypothetical protein